MERYEVRCATEGWMSCTVFKNFMNRARCDRGLWWVLGAVD